MHISASGKIEEILFNTEVSGVENCNVAFPLYPLRLVWEAKIVQSASACTGRRDDHSMAIEKIRAVRVFPATNKLCAAEVQGTQCGAAASAFAGGGGLLKTPYELALLLLLEKDRETNGWSFLR